MNFKKLMIVVVAFALVITVYKFVTRTDRSNANAVANAFTTALKNKDTATASGYFVPDQAQTWREKTDELVGSMRSGAKERFYERIPDAPEFGAVATVAGKSTITSADQSFPLELSQIDGKWYVAKTNFDR